MPVLWLIVVAINTNAGWLFSWGTSDVVHDR